MYFINLPSERSRVVITRKAMAFEAGTPREMTPAESEVGTLSSGVSDIAPTKAGNECHNKTKLRRLNAADPEIELGMYFLLGFLKLTDIYCLAACIVHCRDSKSEAYREFEEPVIKHSPDGGPPTHYEFICKQ
jgi:hypothetical protein